ncbi:EthD family reductase [Corynebacterium sp. YIM 101645]|uniref:EthD family reductase n=1 Tax=Corynebacterium lemuris TaxID=1859292 RepID=A0ABT2FT43_9CORY|nr:EthD family reductase [Corynebacterium lemuris]MCS5478119.1 EthD family reductase [Corynebacterium lemuris]
MVKIVAIVKKQPEQSREEFLHHWNVEHPAYVRELPGIRRYRQNPAITHRKEWPYDGMAELWFDSVKDVAVAYAGPEAEALFKHERLFLGSMEWFIADEVEIDLAVEARA